MNRQQRRAIEALGRKDKRLGEAIDITERAIAILRGNLERFGTTLSPVHHAALYRIVGRFTEMANGRNPGRYAFGLPCGGGKSQAIVAWVAASHGLGRPFSVVVSANTVEGLCEMKRSMVENGVPAEKVGLIHSYGDAASLPPTDDNDARPYLLVTHMKLRNEADLAYLTYRGKRRDLVIYDESLLVSNHWTVGWSEVLGALGALQGHRRAEATAEEAPIDRALAYLNECDAMLDREYRRQRDEGGKPCAVHLPHLSANDVSAYVAALDRKDDKYAPLQALLQMSSAPLRITPHGQGGGGAIQYEVVVPEGLDNIAVLDASLPIRRLAQLSVKRDADFERITKDGVKTYKNVTIHHMKTGAGRNAMTADFDQAKENRKMSAEIVDVVKTIPASEAVIVWTFKARTKHEKPMADVLKRDLQDAGVNVSATVNGNQPRFIFLTWGMECGLSTYQYAENVIMAGVVHRSDLDIAGALVGQRDNLTGRVPHEEVAAVKRSEVAHAIYQAMNRGAARQTVNGEAKRMNVWLPLWDLPETAKLLNQVMPGVQWLTWDANHHAVKTSKTEDVARTIARHLSDLASDVMLVSSRSLRAAFGGGLANVSWQTARDRALALATDWRLVGQSFVRA